MTTQDAHFGGWPQDAKVGSVELGPLLDSDFDKRREALSQARIHGDNVIASGGSTTADAIVSHAQKFLAFLSGDVTTIESHDGTVQRHVTRP